MKLSNKNYFVTLDCQSIESFNQLKTFLDSYNSNARGVGICELCVTEWEANPERREKLIEQHNYALSSHCSLVKENNLF